MSNLEVFAIQDFLSPRADSPEVLYSEPLISGENSTRKSLFTLAPDAKYSGNSYFNSLYLKYWLSFTSVRKFGLEVSYEGGAELRFTAVDKKGKERPAGSYFLKDSGGLSTEVVWPDLPSLVSSSRVYVTVQANSDFHCYGMAFVTDKKPDHDIRLTIGLCTFKREKELAATLNAITDIWQESPEIQKIIVVNHDRPFTHPELLKHADNAAIQIVEQANLGGCGGFNRTMYEAEFSEPVSTHHLLMDDDITLDPRMIPRAIRFLSYAEPKTVLGGHMFDSLKPTVLHEAGARLDHFWYVVSLAQDEDMAKISAVNRFAEVEEADYNAWWFCIFPTEAISKIGYSPPIFIHGDDIEYGCRLTSNGYGTVSLPGVAVWHESFSAKNTDWLQYYDMRNRLIISVTHGEKCRQPDTLYCFGFLMHLLLMHRYRSAMMCMMAMKDFLIGPERLFQTGADEKHQQINSIGKDLDLVEVREIADTSYFRRGEPNPNISSQLRIAFNLIRSVLSILLLKTPKEPHTIHDNKSANPAVLLNQPYLLVDGVSGDRYLEFRPSRLHLVKGTAKAIAVSLRYLLFRKRVTRDWNEKLPAFQTRESWKNIFFGERSN